MHFARIGGDNIDPFEEHRLDRGLPRPQAERIIAERGIIGVEHQGGTFGQMPRGISLGAAEPGRALDQRGLRSQARPPPGP